MRELQSVTACHAIVKFEELSLGAKFEDITFSVGFVAVVNFSLGLVFGVVVGC